MSRTAHYDYSQEDKDTLGQCVLIEWKGMDRHASRRTWRFSFQQKHCTEWFHWLVCLLLLKPLNLYIQHCSFWLQLKSPASEPSLTCLLDSHLCCRGSNESRRPLWCSVNITLKCWGEWTFQGKAHHDPGVIWLDFKLTWCSVYFWHSSYNLWPFSFFKKFIECPKFVINISKRFLREPHSK